MTINRFKRHSINLDDQSHTQCGILAANLALSMSGVIRLLIRNAFATSQHNFEKQDNSRSSIPT
jgi:hypothetical protein